VSFKPPKPLLPVPEELRGATVLVVDDERAWRVILETDLRMLGYEVWLANDAVEALTLARQHPPHVAIIDLMLPEPMDGWALLDALREQGTVAPTVFYTAYSTFPNEPGGADVVAYVSKAADRADLYGLLPDAIKKARSRRR
jgi:two-component system OmpR family response regulator